MPLQLPRPVIAENQKIKVLIYGEPGVGKTLLAGTAAEHPLMAPVLVANIEGGLLTLAGKPGVDEVPVPTSVELEELYWKLHNGDADYKKYKTLVLDTGSVAAARILREWSEIGLSRQLAKGKIREGDRTRDDVELQDYGKAGVHCARIFEWFVQLPMHVIMTATTKERSEKTSNPNDIGAVIDIRPNFTDKLGTVVMAMFDHVWYLYTVDDDTRYLSTRKYGQYVGKTRGEHFNPALGAIVTNPNLASIYELLLTTEGSHTAK